MFQDYLKTDIERSRIRDPKLKLQLRLSCLLTKNVLLGMICTRYQSYRHYSHLAYNIKVSTTRCKESKAIPITDREGPYGYETWMIPRFLDTRLTDGGVVVSLMRSTTFVVLIYVRG
jgi:hypothetical protein